VSTFEVTPSDLTALASQLSSLLGELSQAGDVRSASTSAAENAQLEAAFGDFIGRWSQSLQALQTNLTTLTERLSGAGTQYDSTETDVTSQFGAR
jgi:uncharacterized protein YukE